MFSDLAKAFHTVDHEILLGKLEHYGIRGIVLDQFRSFSTNREQIVKYKSFNSDSLTIKCRVPQGSMLGPLHFLIYINDICESLRILSLILFQMTQTYFIVKNVSTLFNTVNQQLEKAANKLSSKKNLYIDLTQNVKTT